MLIAPRPGADRTNLSQTLRHLLNQAINVRSASDQFDAYVQWAAEGVRTLRNQVSSASLDELVLTKRYWALQSMGALPPYVTRALLQVELTERVDALEATCRSYEEQIASWSRPGIFVVADSSFYIHHIEKVEDLDLRPILEIREEPVHLIFPIAVVDELDRLKNTGTKLARWRARHTLQVLDSVFPLPRSPGRSDQAGRLRNQLQQDQGHARRQDRPPAGHRQLDLDGRQAVRARTPHAGADQLPGAE